MARLVQKFDGSSLCDPERIMQAARLVVAAYKDGYEVASVVSASRQDIRNCLSFAGNLSKQPNIREVHNLLIACEQMTSTLLSLAIESLGCSSRSILAPSLGIESFKKISADELNAYPVETCLGRGEIAVIGGGATITDAKSLPEGISDCSDSLAVALGSAIDADKCEYFIGSNGLYVADPLYVNRPGKVSSLAYDQAAEWSRCGANFMTAEALELAADVQMPLWVRSLPNDNDKGTLISHKLAVSGDTACGIVVDDNFANLSMTSDCEDGTNEPIKGVASIFLRFGELGIDTDMLFMLSREDQPVHELGFVVKEEMLPQVLRIIEANREKLALPLLHVEKGYSRVSVIGNEAADMPTIVSQIFDRLSAAHLPVKLVATTNMRVSLLIPGEFAGYAVKVIHDVIGYVQHKDEVEFS
jgi:aspartate kinase